MAPVDTNVLQELIQSHVNETGGLITALREVMAEASIIDNDAISIAAEVFNLSQAEVLGVISFYDDLRQQAIGDKLIRICQAEACQAVGARELISHASAVLGISMGGTTTDEKYTLLHVSCLGLCANGPAMIIDDKIYAHVTSEKFNTVTNQQLIPLVET